MITERSATILARLKSLGVRAFVVCAGSRNSSMTLALLQSSDVQVFNHFEEREAAFFALGLSKRSKTPVCVVTTSGTAVAELLPACIEAYYTGVQLVLVTADRPARYRQTGAPQSIEQPKIFEEYCLHRFDLTASHLPEISIAASGPTHINICYEESPINLSNEVSNHASVCQTKFHVVGESVAQLHTLLAKAKSPLIMLGELGTDDARAVQSLCLRLGAPIFAEPLSGLRESQQLDHLLIKGGERVLQRTHFDSVIRIGGVPACRYWRDLEFKENCSVFSIDSKPFPGIPGGALAYVPLLDFVAAWSSQSSLRSFAPPDTLKAQDAKAVEKLHSLIYTLPRAEPSLFYQFSHIIHEHDAVFLGNSLPIREWDLAASRKKPHPLIMANRGANGIDGQLSTFFGAIDRLRHNWGIFGDLTSLYGMSAPWIVPQLGSIGATICIINNRGGKIFERVSSLQNKLSENKLKERFTNKHTLTFESLAKMWGISYECVSELSTTLRKPGIQIVEVLPDPLETEKFWNEWDTFWNKV